MCNLNGGGLDNILQLTLKQNTNHILLYTGIVNSYILYTYSNMCAL